MKNLKAFYEYNGKGIKYQDVLKDTVEKYSKVLPDFLIEIWKDKGLSFFNDGFLWLVNPDEYSEVLSFFIPQNKHFHVVLRTAFGGLIFLKTDEDKNAKIKKNYNYFCPIFNRITWLSNQLEDTLNGWLTTDEILNPLMFPDLYSLVRERLSIPKPDECFGFTPSIALGGDFDPENIKIFKLKEHLAFLSQIT